MGGLRQVCEHSPYAKKGIAVLQPDSDQLRCNGAVSVGGERARTVPLLQHHRVHSVHMPVRLARNARRTTVSVLQLANGSRMFVSGGEYMLSGGGLTLAARQPGLALRPPTRPAHPSAVTRKPFKVTRVRTMLNRIVLAARISSVHPYCRNV